MENENKERENQKENEKERERKLEIPLSGVSLISFSLPCVCFFDLLKPTATCMCRAFCMLLDVHKPTKASMIQFCHLVCSNPQWTSAFYSSLAPSRHDKDNNHGPPNDREIDREREMDSQRENKRGKRKKVFQSFFYTVSDCITYLVKYVHNHVPFSVTDKNIEKLSPFEIEDSHFYFASGDQWITSWKDIMDCKEWRYPFFSMSFFSQTPFRRTIVDILKQHDQDSSSFLVKLAPSHIAFAKPLLFDFNHNNNQQKNNHNNNNNNNNNHPHPNQYQDTEWMTREELLECINGAEVYEKFISLSYRTTVL